MNLQHVNVKIFVEGELPVELGRFIDVFHGWVAAQFTAEMLIDVADYRHVPEGPGVLLIGREADYALDETDGRRGLLYNRKAVLEGSNHDRFGQALQSAAKACTLLEAEFDGLRFSREEFQLFINDRGLAPRNEETCVAFRSELGTFIETVLGVSGFDIEDAADSRSRVGAVVRLSTAMDFERVSGG